MRPGAISVRMYNVGFGDCFLIRFPGPDRARTMLIDCGQHSASSKPFDLRHDVIPAVLSDVTGEQGSKRIDVVAVSHRHQDHVKGFEDPRWAEVEVGEVWMPWTEDPNDPVARSLLERQSGGAHRLTSLTDERTPTHMVAMNSLTNEAAMATLHTGFGGSPQRRFLPERPDGQVGDDQPAFPVQEAPALPGVRVRLLGPSTDESVIRRMDPPELDRFVVEPRGDAIVTGAPLPFARWRVDQRAYKSTPDHAHLNLSGLGEVVTAGREDPYLLAVAVEQAVNNTSLMLSIQVGRATLLFPGDSQWGSWDRVLQSQEGRDVLARTTFYKVGHHGSHNATPRTFVQTLLRGAQGMVSVAPTGIPSWQNIPKQDLLDALCEPGRCIALAISKDPDAAPVEAVLEREGLVWEMQVPV